jgi:threonine/homoserine/homoserine lactone efflux protein
MGDESRMEILLRGILVGLSIAAPVGPVNILCIRRTLANGRASGFASGLGAATADAMYGAVAGFGLTVVSDFFIRQSAWLHLVGGIILCVLGLHAFYARPAEPGASAKPCDVVTAYGSTFLLTATNPTTIFAFAAVFAALGTRLDQGIASGSLLVFGVFTGSALWFTLLSGSVCLLRHRLTNGALLWINRVSGVLIVGLGVYALLKAR